MNTATKPEIDAAKTACKRVVQKTAQATGYFIGNKIADKITSVDKIKSKEKEDKKQQIYKPPEKRQKIIRKATKLCLKILQTPNGIPENTNLLGTTLD